MLIKGVTPSLKQSDSQPGPNFHPQNFQRNLKDKGSKTLLGPTPGESTAQYLPCMALQSLDYGPAPENP